jgi:hypothetical protein
MQMAETGTKPLVEVQDEKARPVYEKPRIQAMSEQDILNTFQITQAMQTWWNVC